VNVEEVAISSNPAAAVLLSGNLFQRSRQFKNNVILRYDTEIHTTIKKIRISVFLQ